MAVYIAKCLAAHPLSGRPGSSRQGTVHGAQLGATTEPIEPTERAVIRVLRPGSEAIREALLNVAPGCEGFYCRECKAVSEYRREAA